MADTTENEAKISIKVTVDKVNKRVVCAEADHSFVDILFSFITLPIGTIVRLLGKLDDKNFETLGSFNNLYQSLKDFPECYISTKECKSMLLNPRSLSYDHCRKLRLKIDDTEPIHYFICTYFCCSRYGKFMSCNNVSLKDNSSRQCCCGMWLNAKDSYWYSGVGVGGGAFVSDIATFIITDNLCVEPYSSARSIRLLTDLGITDMNHLEERTLQMSSYQMLYFLKLALSTDCPLTSFIFSKINPLPDFVGSGQNHTFDQCDLVKQEAPATSKMRLEVSLQKSTGKLLFAESNEDFIEFLFGFLSIPLGTVIGTLTKGVSSFSCIDNILKSISNMSVGRYLKSQDIKDMLLKPHIGQQCCSKNQVFPLKGVPTRVSEREIKDPVTDEKYLKESGMFLVTDDLTITPSSLFSTLGILKKLNVPPEDVEKQEVNISLKEGLGILKASLSSCSTLTKSVEHQLKK